MKGHLELLVEDASGTPVGSVPRWRAEDRGFLWDFVHDTRGVLRRSVSAAHLDRIRRVEPAGREEDDDAFRLDAADALEAYEAAAESVGRLGRDGPWFHWVAPEGSEDWAAVVHWRSGDRQYSLVGGWSQPSLRGGPDGTEPIESIPSGQEAVSVGGTTVRIRRQTIAERFRDDLASLLSALRQASAAGHRVRFRQR